MRTGISRALQLLACLPLVACLGASSHHPGTGVQLNLPIRTLGGVQFWGDVEWRDGWRIQQNVWFRHHRLLDPQDVRRAWGSRAACRSALDEHVPSQAARGEAHEASHLVLLLHGLGRSRHSMKPLAESLRAAGLRAACLSYPSTREDVAEHARRLNGLLDELEGVTRVSFVTHSMGGLVVREALGDRADWRARIELGRIVQLGPPNQGSELARIFHPTPVRWLMGPCLTTVATNEAAGLPLPPCELAIVAGGKCDDAGWNPLLAGDDDGVVRVDETRLESADTHVLVRDLHTFMMDNERVALFVRRFLEDGPAGGSVRAQSAQEL